MKNVIHSLLWSIGRHEKRFPVLDVYREMEDRSGVIGVLDAEALLDHQGVRIWTTDRLLNKSAIFSLAEVPVPSFMSCCRQEGIVKTQNNGWVVFDFSGQKTPDCLLGRIERLRADTIQKDREDTIYIMRDRDTGEYKIGYTARDPIERRNEIEYISGRDVEIICSWRGNTEQEAALHRIFDDYRTVGEWFNFSSFIFLKNFPNILDEIK